jgi:mRNA-degrading endonuclease toxin of MazEF toxin-antitoxin module
VAVVDQINAAAKERFIRKLGTASREEMAQIGSASSALSNLE